jgi:MFS family permease
MSNQTQSGLSPNYKWWVVAMLWCISFFNYADRQAVFSIFPLLEKEMNLDPVQLGLLGSSFAWVYGLSAPLAGMIVDRVKRVKAILGGLHAWSIICMATALSRNFGHLLFFRAAEGLGETFYYPASMSLVSDYHGKESRSRAMGVHQTSVYVGTIAGGFFAGWIGQVYGWRWSFIVFGGLGVLLGFVLHKFLHEPVRGAADGPAAPASAVAGGQAKAPEKLTAGQTFALILRKPTAMALMLAFMCANFVAVVLLSWMPKFLHDKFELNLAMAGLAATVFAQVASMTGAPIGGWLADKLRAKSAGGRMMVQATGVLLGAPMVALCGLTGEITWLLVALTGWGFFKGLYDANIFASMYDVIPANARGSAAGLMNTVGWLGGGTAPLLIGVVASKTSLGFAIALASAVYVMAGLILLTAVMFFVKKDALQAVSD